MSQRQRLQKLLKMPPREILDRIAGVLRVWQERRLYQRRQGGHDFGGNLSLHPANLLDSATTLVPGTTSDQLRSLEANFPQAHATLAAAAKSRADAVLSGSWNVLGFPVDLGKSVDWHRDPRTDYRFPRTFYADLSLYELGDEIDVKYVWELGRHQFAVELARGWLFTGEERYARRARELILDWIAKNPLYEGVHWTSSLELAMRAIAWIWTLASLAQWDGWEPDDLSKIKKSLAEHATDIEHHLSYYSSPYNHLVGEAAGLYVIGQLLSGTDIASRWSDLGRRVLGEHGPQQFYDDGFCVEQATGYHFYTLGFLSLAISAARHAGEPLLELEPVVQRAFRTGLAFRQPGGRWPAIGDVDSARAIPVHHEDFWAFDSLCGLGASLFTDPQLKPSRCHFSEEAYWLLGCDGIEALAGFSDEAGPSAAILKDSGYAIACSEDDWLCFDAGPLGDGLHADATPSTAHGHADALQVLYRHNRRDVLIDPGMPFYFGDDEWVGHFRAPAAHNTLEIEGVAMARRAGRLAWSHVARRAHLDVNLGEEAWIARGEAEWSPGVVVERNLLAIPGRGLWIADWISSDPPRRVQWYWQLPAGSLHGSVQRAGTRSLVEGDHLQLMTWTDAATITTTMESAEDASPIAWTAPGYGVRHPGQRVRCEVAPASPVLVVTFFGSAPLPLEIFTHNRRLECWTADEADEAGETSETSETGETGETGETSETSETATSNPRDDEMGEADIVWRLDIEGTQVTYSTGNRPDKTDGEHDLINGIGNWPVTRQTSSPLPVREIFQ